MQQTTKNKTGSFECSIRLVSKTLTCVWTRGNTTMHQSKNSRSRSNAKSRQQNVVEASASRLEVIALRLEATAIDWRPLLVTQKNIAFFLLSCSCKNASGVGPAITSGARCLGTRPSSVTQFPGTSPLNVKGSKTPADKSGAPNRSKNGIQACTFSELSFATACQKLSLDL